LNPDPNGQFIGSNLDIGHYVAGSKNKSPIPVLEKYHDRIVNLHLKDRTADGGSLPWGQGQTPIKEVLQLMRKEKWTFPAEPERSGDRPPKAARKGERSESNRAGIQNPRRLRRREGSG